ncbi:hypothetical protein HRG_002643 [Hirsutella rhossiliensis]|uniref:Uncharacterized protein n=1 Tax=Hirsutella rhossiliensis TaxID=111463 RepID=A0A9P8SMD7_9HYPO|nr:uncharacterized protein HRG_02643 [Hirsutella rhossiliensis]KAH0967234.1 hypothetical protein HRG_02643 [Hirsutella rhossiliensis]
MAPRLDLSSVSTHAKVMVAPPRMNLRRAASYNHQERVAGSLSATSSRFNFNHLLFSPPPSPSLPALVQPPRRRSSQIFAARPSWILRRLFYLGALVAIFYLLALVWGDGWPMQTVLPHVPSDEFEMVGQDTVPDFPTPIVVSDRGQRPKWTVAIPRDYDFPLSINEYAGMSGRCREVSAHARDLHNKPPLTDHEMLAHDRPDAYFVDVDDAERTGLLPPVPKDRQPRHSGHFVGLNWESMAGTPVCRSSLTFVMESSDAGLGASLMTMWTLYALAKEQGRGFFVDDSRWAYGAYTDIFQPPPLPDCRPPLRHQMLPCPAQARHLVVSTATARHVLPDLLARHDRITGMATAQQDLFELARTGHGHLFALIKEDQDYVHQRIKELQGEAKKGDKISHGAPIIGLHIRRGDRHPLEYQYRGTYIPTEVFARHAQQLVESHHNQSGIKDPQPKAITVIASDDPAVHREPDLSDAVLAQQRIRLASKEAVEKAVPNPRILHRFVEEAQGWDGGFFALMFWNLGDDRKKTAATSVPGDGPEPATAPSQETLRLRGFIGRAYMMDLAVLAGASDRVVCAVSAMGCRLLGVMMGWERAMEQGAWVNVDGGYGWSGLGW